MKTVKNGFLLLLALTVLAVQGADRARATGTADLTAEWNAAAAVFDFDSAVQFPLTYQQAQLTFEDVYQGSDFDLDSQGLYAAFRNSQPALIPGPFPWGKGDKVSVLIPALPIED